MLLLDFVAAGLGALAARVTFNNDHYYYFDVDGSAIDSTNGKVEWVKDQYFWISEPDSCLSTTGQCDKISYSSKDLVNWVYNGPLFNLAANAAHCSGFGSCSRPKVVYNAATDNYVLYGFASIPGAPPSIPVFTSNTLTSGYTFAGNMFPNFTSPGYGVEDLGLAVIDGKGYLTWTGFDILTTVSQPPLSSIWPPFIQTVQIQQLSTDYLSGVGAAYPVIQAGGDFPVTQTSANLIDGQIESPDIFKRGNTYYMVGSATCAFCAGTLAVAFRGPSLSGPWTRQVIDSSDTCGGQAMGVMKVPAVPGLSNDTFVFHADAFHTIPTGGHTTASHGHGFWPLSFDSDGSIKRIDCTPRASFSIIAPISSQSIPVTGRAVAATDSSSNYGDYWSETGLLTERFLYQTWGSSKAGNLTEVGVNLALNAPVANPLLITIFTYANEAALLSPFFKWTVLATKVIGETTSPVAPGFKVIRVPVGAAVSKGQRIGIALTVNGGLPSLTQLPYAYLMEDTGSMSQNAGHALYSLTRGHVSLDGLGANVSPVRKVPNREIKWYATVV